MPIKEYAKQHIFISFLVIAFCFFCLKLIIYKKNGRNLQIDEWKDQKSSTFMNSKTSQNVEDGREKKCMQRDSTWLKQTKRKTKQCPEKQDGQDKIMLKTWLLHAYCE